MVHGQARSRSIWAEEEYNVLAIFLQPEDWAGFSWSVVGPELLESSRGHRGYSQPWTRAS